MGHSPDGHRQTPLEPDGIPGIERKSSQRVPLPIVLHVVATAGGTESTCTERFQSSLTGIYLKL